MSVKIKTMNHNYLKDATSDTFEEAEFIRWQLI